MKLSTDIAHLSFYGNPLIDWAAATGITLGILVLLRVIQAVGLKHVKNLAVRMRVPWADLVLDTLQKTNILVLLVLSAYAGAMGLKLPAQTQTIIHSAAIIAFLLQAGLWATGLLDSWLARYREAKLTTNPSAVTSMGAIGLVIRGTIWTCVTLLALDNLGVNITALVAGLGIGGVAVALAAQNILGDLFSSLTIAIDKPFVVGDFLNLGPDHMGAVEYIGMKGTRLRSLTGEQIILSNSDVLNSRIRNFGRMFERRAIAVIGVTYQTPRDKLKMIPGIIRQAIESEQKTRFDRAHFKTYGAYSLDFEYVYYVLAPDYNTYMDINQAINFAIHERFEAEGIEFAYPTQTLFIEKNQASGAG